MKALVVVVADKSMQQTLEGLLARPQALGIRQVEMDISEILLNHSCYVHGGSVQDACHCRDVPSAHAVVVLSKLHFQGMVQVVFHVSVAAFKV